MNNIFSPEKNQVISSGDFNPITDICNDGQDRMSLSDYKESASVLKINQDKYKFLFENAVESIIVIQGIGIKLCNLMAQELLGYSAEEITAMPFLDFIYHEDL